MSISEHNRNEEEVEKEEGASAVRQEKRFPKLCRSVIQMDKLQCPGIQQVRKLFLLLLLTGDR